MRPPQAVSGALESLKGGGPDAEKIMEAEVYRMAAYHTDELDELATWTRSQEKASVSSPPPLPHPNTRTHARSHTPTLLLNLAPWYLPVGEPP